MIRAFLVALLLATQLPSPPRRPHDPAHPGGDAYTYGFRRYQVAGAGGFGLVYYLPQPRTGSPAGRYPVLAFAHGKQLYGGSLLAPGRPLDNFYAAFLEHLARKGYVAAFPQMEAGLLDGDRPAQAARFLAALRWLGAHVPAADTRRLIFAGHSMGADVALLAAVLASRTRGHVVPRAVLAMAPVDEDVVHHSLVRLPRSISVTFVAGEQDTVAPPRGAVSLWSVLAGHRRQVIELTGDRGAHPPLLADHNLSTTNGTLPAALGGVPRLDALDWYGTWKLAVGLLDYTFQHGDARWIWGRARLDGGTDGSGRHLRYRALP